VTPWDDFGNDFGNKTVVLPHTLEISIELAERVGFADYTKIVFKVNGYMGLMG
jgi:hypothetical protein